MSPEPEKKSSEKHKIAPWKNGNGIALELEPTSKNEAIRLISYGKNRIGMYILEIQSCINNQWPVVKTPTLSDLKSFKEVLENAAFHDQKLDKIVNGAKIATNKGIRLLQKEEVSSY
jgi:hypothetical protein